MKVRDLVNKLKQFNQDLKVSIKSDLDTYYIDNIKQSGSQVLISVEDDFDDLEFDDGVLETNIEDEDEMTLDEEDYAELLGYNDKTEEEMEEEELEEEVDFSSH